MAKKSDYSLLINFFFNSLKKNRIIHYFLGSHYSLFIIFLANYSLFIIKKGHDPLIIIPHPDPHAWSSCFHTLIVMIYLRPKVTLHCYYIYLFWVLVSGILNVFDSY